MIFDINMKLFQSVPLWVYEENSFLNNLTDLLRGFGDMSSTLYIPSFHLHQINAITWLFPIFLCFHTWSNSKFLTDTPQYLHILSLSFYSIGCNFCRVRSDTLKQFTGIGRENSLRLFLRTRECWYSWERAVQYKIY